jgi:intein/homing endonuclease
VKKTKYKKTRKLNSNEAAYIAGLIDGEGTITLSRQNQNRERQIAVTIDNTDLDLLKWVLSTTEVGKITKKNPYNPRDSIAFVYQIYSRQALDLLSQILPFLHTYKRKRAELAIKKYIKLTPRNGRYSKRILAKRKNFIKAFFSINQKGEICSIANL